MLRNLGFLVLVLILRVGFKVTWSFCLVMEVDCFVVVVVVVLFLSLSL